MGGPRRKLSAGGAIAHHHWHHRRHVAAISRGSTGGEIRRAAAAAVALSLRERRAKPLTAACPLPLASRGARGLLPHVFLQVGFELLAVRRFLTHARDDRALRHARAPDGPIDP